MTAATTQDVQPEGLQAGSALTEPQPADLQPGVAPMPLSGWLRNWLGWAFIFVTCVTMGAPVVLIQAVLFPFGLANRWGDFTVQWWIGTLSWLWRVELEVSGLEHIERGQTYVLACNHRRHLDPVSCLLAMKHDLRFGFIMKRALSLIPIWGWFIWMNGYIPIDRGRGKRGKDQLATGVKYLKQGRSVMMYPEGTRSPDHRFRRFKRGAVVLAIRAGVPVLPVAVSGTARLWPKNRWHIRPGRVRVEVLRPIPTRERSLDERDEVLAQVRKELVDRYRPTWDGLPLEEQPGLRAALAPEPG
jgi:1-acyl-sn-glycerol-3-phosphate acyltransferase